MKLQKKLNIPPPATPSYKTLKYLLKKFQQKNEKLKTHSPFLLFQQILQKAHENYPKKDLPSFRFQIKKKRAYKFRTKCYKVLQSGLQMKAEARKQRKCSSAMFDLIKGYVCAMDQNSGAQVLQLEKINGKSLIRPIRRNRKGASPLITLPKRFFSARRIKIASPSCTPKESCKKLSVCFFSHRQEV